MENKKIEEMTIEELRIRAGEIREAVNAPDADLEALDREATEISKRITQYNSEQQLREISQKVGAEGTLAHKFEDGSAESRAKKFLETGRGSISAKELRSVLVSSGDIVTPTEVNGINDIVGSKVSSIVDMVKVVNCVGMGKNRVAYIDADANAANTQTEGNAATTTEPSFGYVDISPTSVAVLAQISKQTKKQSPLAYEQKVQDQALISLRKKAAALITAALKASTLNSSVAATLSSTKGIVDDKTLRKIVMAYGGDESIIGGNAVLFLNKTDLIAFGDVRGTNEKKAVYEITPDGANPNTGIIKDGGLSVRYCINSNLTACAGTSQTDSAQTTMYYGNPMCFELDLFSDYEIRVSEDFAFDKLMDTIRGDVELGGDVIAKGGFVALTIAANT